jgi:hypothetical protein
MPAVNEKFNVGGVILDRPFKIRRLGHFGFNLAAMEEGRRFYVDLLGFKISDVMDYSKRAKDPAQMIGLGDPNGYFTRYGTDHHAMVLFPKRVRDALGRRRRARRVQDEGERAPVAAGGLRESGCAICRLHCSASALGGGTSLRAMARRALP